MAVLLDTSALVALANRSDAHHHDVVAAVAGITEPVVVPLSVLPEVDYLLSRDIGSQAVLAIMRSVNAGELLVDHLIPSDLPRVTQLMETYADANIGFVDSSLVAVAERLNIVRIVTLDRRHFHMLRPRHVAAFDLLP